MSEKKRNKIFVLVGCFLVLTVFLGISYAYWMFSATQKEKNVAATQCISIDMEDISEGITIEQGVPISDEEGMVSTPYKFRVTNTCDNAVEYNINLEVLDIENRLASKYVDVMLDDLEPRLLTSYGVAESPTYRDDTYEAIEAYILKRHLLGAKQTEEHEVRMWMDKDATEEAQNKLMLSKVTINATNIKYVDTTPKILAYQGGRLIKTVDSAEVSIEESIYSNSEIQLQVSGFSSDNNYYYALSADGEKIKIENGILNYMPTEEGVSLYLFVEDASGEMSQNYTKLNLYYQALGDINYQIAAGTQRELPTEIEGVGTVIYGASADDAIAVIENNVLIAKKGGNVDIAYSDESGAVGTIHVKVSEITLEKANGLLLVSGTKNINYEFVNSENITVSSENSAIATVEKNENRILISAISPGDAKIVLEDANGYRATYTIKVANIELNPNGGSNLLGDSGSAQIKTIINPVNTSHVSYGWSNSNTTGPSSYEELVGTEIVRENSGIGSYYLWVKINENEEEEIFVSNAFSTFESSIVITPSEANPTKDDYIVTVTFPEETEASSRKVGFGATISDAKNNMTDGNSLTVTQNGYVYAEAVDASGNKITATLAITNIDKEGPTIGEIKGTTEASNVGTINVTGIGDALNRADGYYITKDTTTPNLALYKTLRENTINETVDSNGTYYVWIKDNLGNTSTFEVTVSGIVEKVSNIVLNDTYVGLEHTNNVNISYSGTPENIVYTSSDTNIVSIENDKVKGIKDGSVTLTATITDYDGTVTTVTGNVYVTSISLNKNSILLKTNESQTITINGSEFNGEYRVSSDSSDAEVNLNNNQIYVAVKNTTGSFKVTVFESNGGATSILTVNVVDARFNINGGTYQMPTSGDGKIESTITAAGENVSYAWNNSSSIAPTSWTNVTDTNFVKTINATKTDCKANTNYYLWVKFESDGDEVTFVSNAFTLVDDEIVITPAVTGYTNSSYNVSIAYPRTTATGTKKAGYGTDLNTAISSATTTSSSVTTVTVTNNGYVYAEAVDEMGNKVTASLEITNFDNVTAPTITGGSTTYAASRTISVSVAGSATSGVKHYEYYTSTSSTAPTASTVATGTTTNQLTITTEGTTYVWYRTVSNGGTKSAWSASQTVNIYYPASSVTYTNSANTTIVNVKNALDTIYGW